MKTFQPMGHTYLTGQAPLFAFIFGSSYHKLVEEKELEIRFGEDYVLYRKKTPFLIPRFWK